MLRDPKWEGEYVSQREYFTSMTVIIHGDPNLKQKRPSQEGRLYLFPC
jgi:hypothetical protein